MELGILFKNFFCCKTMFSKNILYFYYALVISVYIVFYNFNINAYSDTNRSFVFGEDATIGENTKEARHRFYSLEKALYFYINSVKLSFCRDSPHQVGNPFFCWAHWTSVRMTPVTKIIIVMWHTNRLRLLKSHYPYTFWCQV